MSSIVKEVEELAKKAIQKAAPPSYTFISTGSTLLDLAIAGGRIRGGGLPGQTIVEIFGPPGSGKSALVAETAGYVQRAGGEVLIGDPEARLDTEYCQIYGVHIDKKIYFEPKTVTAVFDRLVGPVTKDKRDFAKAWCPDPDKVNVYVVDSLAALSTDMEIETGDKRGQRRAKEFSEGFRLSSVHIKEYNILFLATNQIRDADGVGIYKTYDSPGGRALKHYIKLRIQLGIKSTDYDEAEVRGVTQKRAIGINVEAKIVKNQVDIPFRTAPIYIRFNYGIDDVYANLKWLMDNGGFPVEEGKKKASYKLGDKRFISLAKAVEYAEENGLENEIRERTIDLWNEIESHFVTGRQKKRE